MSDLSSAAETLGYLRGATEAILLRLDAIEAAQKAHSALHQLHNDKLDGRVGKLERGRAWLLGAAATLGLGGGALVDQVPIPPPGQSSPVAPTAPISTPHTPR